MTDRTAFDAEYDRILARWPAPMTTVELTSPFGTTVVRVSGPAEAAPLVLLPAFGATSAEWIELADALKEDRRIYAVDLPGDAGGSNADGQPIATPPDLQAWIDTVLDGLGLAVAAFGGHSYGGWIALDYALVRQDRVESLTLLDPTMCFAPLIKGYIFRAMPVLLKPTGDRRRSLIAWETRNALPDPEWLQLTAHGVDAFPSPVTVPTKLPKAEALKALDRPVLVIVAGQSRVHEVRRVARDAQKHLPNVRVEVLPGASHYGLPMTHAAEIAALLTSQPLS